MLSTTACKYVQNLLRNDLHIIHCAGIGSRNWQSRDECTDGHAHIECGICRNAVVIAAAVSGLFTRVEQYDAAPGRNRQRHQE